MVAMRADDLAFDVLVEPFTVIDNGRLATATARADDIDRFPAPAHTEADLIAQSLAWCAGLFGVESSRLVRSLPSGGWAIVTWRRDGILAYAADYAEVAMTWMVGLARQPLIVNRPRVMQPDGGNVRPISAKTYVGVPIMCQDQLIGVVEIAGDLRVDVESTVAQALSRLTLVAQRIVHDPSLRPAPLVTPETRCALDGGVAFSDEMILTLDERRFLFALTGALTIAEISVASGIELRDALPVAAGLTNRGLLTIVD